MRLKTKFHFHSQAISLCNQCTERVVDLRLTIRYSLCGTFCINLTFHSSPPTFSVVGCHLVRDNRSEITADLYLTEQDLSSCTIIKCSSTLKSSEKSTETKWKPTHSYIKQCKCAGWRFADQCDCSTRPILACTFIYAVSYFTAVL